MRLLTIKAQSDSPQRMYQAELGPYNRRFGIGSNERQSASELVNRFGQTVYTCINLRANVAASIPLRLFSIGNAKQVEKSKQLKCKPLDKRTKAFLHGRMPVKASPYAMKKIQGNQDDMTEITNHPVLDLFDNVNDQDEGWSFRHLMHVDMDIFGEHWWKMIANGPPDSIERLIPTLIKVIPSDRNFMRGVKYGRLPNEIEFFADELIWYRMPDPNDRWKAYGPLAAALRIIDADFAMRAFQEDVFARGGMPEWILIDKKGMISTPEQKRTFRSQFRRMFGGIFGKMFKREEHLLVVSGDVELEKGSHSPKELDFKDSLIHTRNAIANAFGIPISFFDTEGVVANSTEGRNQFKQNTIWPMCLRLEERWNQKLMPRFSERLVLVHDNPVEEDRAIVIQEAEGILKVGGTPNQALMVLGYEELADNELGDEPMVSNAIIPLRMAGQPQFMLPDMSGSAQIDPETGQPMADTNTTPAPKLEEGQIETAESTVLNGAQVTAATAIVVAVAAGEIPRDAGIGQLEVLFNLTTEQAERIMGSAGTSTPTTPNPNPAEEARLEAQVESARGTLGGNGGNSRNTDRTEDEKGLSHCGNRSDAGRAEASKGVCAACGTVHGKAEDGLDRMPGVHQNGTGGHRGGNDGDGSGNGASGVIKQSEIWHSDNCPSMAKWELACYGYVSTCASLCWLTHKALDDPQEGLPEDGSVRGFVRRMESTLRKQIDEAVAQMQVQAVPQAAVQAFLRVVHDPKFIGDIAEAARPFLERAITIGGTFGAEKLSQHLPDAIGFDVTNPEVQRFVDRYSVRFATQVNGTTEIAARRILGDGLQQGETIPQLTNRVKEWAGEVGDATRGTGARAEMIARTESARAYEKGQIEAWKQSGVVEGKQWLLAPDACEFCEAIAAQFNNKTVGLQDSFLAKGTVLQGTQGGMMTLDYEDIDAPPLHPQCRCDTIPVIMEVDE